MEKLRSHYPELLHVVNSQRKRTAEGIAVTSIPLQMARSEGSDIFEEGDDFSGNIRKGVAEASLTITSSPHFFPDIPIGAFTAAAEAGFGKAVTLQPALPVDAKLAPHLVLWWQKKEGNEASQSNIFSLYYDNSDVRSDFIYCIDQQAQKGLKTLLQFEGIPIIYGTWGHGTLEERAKYGLSRGGLLYPKGIAI